MFLAFFRTFQHPLLDVAHRRIYTLMVFLWRGRVLFELADVDEATAREALRLAMHKLPIKCKFVVREDSVKEDGTNEG